MSAFRFLIIIHSKEIKMLSKLAIACDDLFTYNQNWFREIVGRFIQKLMLIWQNFCLCFIFMLGKKFSHTTMKTLNHSAVITWRPSFHPTRQEFPTRQLTDNHLSYPKILVMVACYKQFLLRSERIDRAAVLSEFKTNPCKIEIL